MNRDDVIRMAREAGATVGIAEHGQGFARFNPGQVACSLLSLERFAALVAAAEREACAQVCDGMHEEDRPGDYAYAIRARGLEHSSPKMRQAEPENVPADSSAGAALRAGGTSWPESVPKSVPSGPAFAEFMLGKPFTSPDCWCETCDSAANHGLRSRMSLCPQCGNKRCPRATHHDNACTGSNAPGQKGSSWEHVKPAS